MGAKYDSYHTYSLFFALLLFYPWFHLDASSLILKTDDNILNSFNFIRCSFIDPANG